MPGPEPVGPRARHHRPARVIPAARWLRWALAGLWLLDAGLQLQPAMFGQAFSSNVLYNSALMYQPPGLEGFLYRAASLQAHHLILLSALIAAVQVVIGVGLLWKPLARPALLLSIGWAAVVWVLGQGFGFMATGTAMIEFGAPGSAVLYIVLALVVLRSLDRDGQGERSGPRTAQWAWSGFWALGALLHLPWRYSVGAVLAYNLQTAAQLQPSHLSGLDYTLARAAYVNSVPVSLILGSLELLLAIAVWLPIGRRGSIWLGLALTACFWVLGQALGGMLTGVAPDPGTGPPVALLGLYLLNATARRVPEPNPEPAAAHANWSGSARPISR